MDACLTIAIIIIVTVIIGILLVIIIGRRPRPLFNIPNRDLLSFKIEALNKLSGQGYHIKERKNGDIFVQKDNFSATTLVFRQNGLGVDVLFIHTSTNVFLAVFVVLLFLFWIAAIVIAIIADIKSKEFRENEITPLLTGHSLTGRICPNCGRPIPFDANLCPYCGLRF